MSAWLAKLLAIFVFLLRTLRGRGTPQLPPVNTYSWDTCSDCRVSLPGHVHRLMDASYCQRCHDHRVDELASESDD